MIPERNLLKGVAGGKEKESIVNFLSDCLKEGGNVILKIPKLCQYVSIYRKTRGPPNVWQVER
jgi:hypothetical protein